MIFQERCFSYYILLTDQTSLSDCFYFLRYWGICVLQLFVSQISATKYFKIKTHWRHSANLKTNKNEHKLRFFDLEKYAYSENLFITLYIEIKRQCWSNFLRTKQTLFHSRAPNHHSWFSYLSFTQPSLKTIQINFYV